MLYTEQSRTSASACCSTTSSFTEPAKPEAKTSKPLSRKANDNSSAISGVSSMSRMRRKRTLLFAAGPGAGQSRLLARGRLQIQNPDAPARRVIGAVVVLNERAPGLQRAHGESVSFKIIFGVAQHFIRVPIVGEGGVAGVHAHDGIKAVKGSFVPDFTRRSALFA